MTVTISIDRYENIPGKEPIKYDTIEIKADTEEEWKEMESMLNSMMKTIRKFREDDKPLPWEIKRDIVISDET